MESISRTTSGESSSERCFADQDIQRCPFLRNINEPTNFSFSSSLSCPIPVSIRNPNDTVLSSNSMLTLVARHESRGTKGPIFEDGPHFDMAFRLFHGRDGVVPLAERSFPQPENLERVSASQFNPLAAKAATISLSAFGPGGLFSFDSFSQHWKKQARKPPSKKESSQQGNSHEAMSNEWLETGNCPIAKSYRAVSNVLPLVAKVLQPPPGMKFKCPPAVVAARAALARTALVKTLRPQPLHSKMLVIGMLGMAANVPLGIWREHTKKFSPAWFAAIHAAIPFIAMLRKSVLMPKSAMAFTIAASVLGQVIGSRAERLRLKKVAMARVGAESVAAATGILELTGNGDVITARLAATANEGATNCQLQNKNGSCGVYIWDPLPLKAALLSSARSIC